MNQNYHKLAVTLLEKVGGKDNVINVYHCVTRLRFQLKDSSIPNTEEIEKIQGVLGLSRQGDNIKSLSGRLFLSFIKRW
ncbi:PTS transporter subunit EIIB [Gallintestinimicrobium sp.]|uniref:PTS transporter subunit EIIB n=1 Tax=Gallintestinimicrobium sp. TaxID=2981655 RepID=UPI003994BBA9